MRHALPLALMRLVPRLLVPVLLVPTLLTGCSWFTDDKGLIVDRNKDYLKAQERADLVIPEGLKGDRIQDPAP
ncbi:MAG: hypothetical protein ACKOZX_13595, partial [Gammaproteobacteria bacterium]